MAKSHISNHFVGAGVGEDAGRSERMTLKSVDLPFCVAAFLSFVASVTLWFTVDQLSGIFVGIWVPSILSLWCGVRSILKDQQEG